MTKISVLPTDSSPTLTDYVPTVDVETSTTKKTTLSSIKTLIAPSQTRRAEFTKNADGSGGSVISQQEANEIAFSGTPSTYGRLNVMLPMDYVSGTTATVKLLVYSTNSNNMGINYYIGVHGDGDTFSSWNIQNNQNTASGMGLTTNIMKAFSVYTIAGASLAAGKNVTVALKPNAAITGTIYLVSAYLEYTASV